MTYEIVKKDLNALTKEEQMDVVYRISTDFRKDGSKSDACSRLSSAPELIGLLSELKDALEQLENKVNPLVEKIKGRESGKKGAMRYIEVKQLLLQSFCQAITFYLLLKSEAQPVRDHPVVTHLVEIKSLYEKGDLNPTFVVISSVQDDGKSSQFDSPPNPAMHLCVIFRILKLMQFKFEVNCVI
ncbi:protein THALLO-like isoform X2 [Salvia miltiorrhiza]|uniref:protein THALLO-like isoform X2 n=1 Tax=Salvia miltiorrhiza TaxID=226208 RepID=UPI0025AC048C|nr:protein THALLO-like isoform X2 [Salvia miltiorrhiza]